MAIPRTAHADNGSAAFVKFALVALVVGGVVLVGFSSYDCVKAAQGERVSAPFAITETALFAAPAVVLDVAAIKALFDRERMDAGDVLLLSGASLLSSALVVHGLGTLATQK